MAPADFCPISEHCSLLAAGMIGAIMGKLMPAKFKTGGGRHGTADKAHGPALIDDDTPPPAHARFSWGKLIVTTAIFVAIWAASLNALNGLQTLHDMSVFFHQSRIPDHRWGICGASLRLPARRQHYGWLTGPQMMDGLALGETTPGPLIMVVTWIGYLGAGLAGAAVALIALWKYKVDIMKIIGACALLGLALSWV